MGWLSTHILDTMQGKPANDVAVELHVLEADGSWRALKHLRTNADGRTDAPLIGGRPLPTGRDELRFAVDRKSVV
mgnify:CR=1 FL=1